MTWVLWVMVPMVYTPTGRSGATFVKALAQSECGQFCHFGICGTNWDRHQAGWHGDFLRAKGMGVSVRLPVDSVWNGGSDLQTGVEIYYWEHTEFWLIQAAKMTQFWDPNFPLPCGQLAAPFL